MAPLSESAVRQALDAELAGADGDVLSYAAGCLADSDLSWGDEADGFAGAFDAVGAVLEEACGGEEAVKALLGRLAAVLNVSATPQQPAAAAPARTTPFVMGGLTAAEAGTGLGKVAKGACSWAGGPVGRRQQGGVVGAACYGVSLSFSFSLTHTLLKQG
jgi:hypothetical protein